MSHEKLRIHNTPLDNIVANLRGEVGEITQSWLLMRRLMAAAAPRAKEEGVDELGDPELNALYALRDRLEGDMVARLAELAEPKIGRLTFYFASKKLKDRFDPEVETFSRFIRKYRFTEKRNAEISHKELPEQWSNRAPIHIQYPMLLKALALATRLMPRRGRA